MVWDRPEVEVIGRRKERLVLSLLVVLVMASLADTIRFQLGIEPPLLATRASLRLFRSDRFVETPFDRNVFWGQWGFLVVAREPRARLVEVAERALAAVRRGTTSARGPANRVACKSRATTRATTNPFRLCEARSYTGTTGQTATTIAMEVSDVQAASCEGVATGKAASRRPLLQCSSPAQTGEAIRGIGWLLLTKQATHSGGL